MRYLFLFFFSFTCFVPGSFIFAAQLQSSDLQYYIHKNPDFSFIFSENFLQEQEFQLIYNKLQYYNQIYTKSFQIKLKEIPSYIFASSRNQMSNGLTSGSPLKVIFFPTGVDLITKMAITNWTDTLIAHEMVHVYQIGQVSNSIRFFLSIFKSSNVIFIPWPIFLNVNMGMSSFFLEGHATFSESLHAYGGRLYSGYTRALVFSQIKHRFKTTDQFIRNYLINTTLKHFATEQHYYHGAYFFSFLREKYDSTQIDSIFSRHAEHFIIPLSFLSIKDTFQFSFKTTFENLVHQYIQKFLPLAKKQNQSEEKEEFRSRICPAFNQDEDSIFFLTSHLTGPPILRTLNKKNGEWKKEIKLFSTGKIFKIKNKFYVSASRQVSPTELTHGLFAEGMYLEKYKSQSLQDLHEDNWLSIDTTNNTNGFNLLLNGKFYSKTHSTAFFGPNGDIYFFKQEKDQRILYKNKQPLFQFRGFYGKPVEVTTEGTVYFTAASPYGSSLFSWTKEKGIHRLSNSDVIIDAIPVPGDKFLICEIEPEFYSYKFISPIQIKESPVFYNYPFKTASNAFLLKTIENNQMEEEEINVDDSFALESDNDIQLIDHIEEVEEKIQQAEEQSLPVPSSVEHSSPMESATESSEEILPLDRKPQNTSPLSYTTYHALKNIRYRGISVGINNDSITKYKIFAGMNFIDSIGYNQLQLNYEILLRENWAIQAKYINQMHRLNWSIAYTYKQGLQNFSGERAYSYNHKVSQGFIYPIFLKGYWSSKAGLDNSFSYHQIRDIDQQFYYISVHPALQLNYNRSYSRSHSAHRNLLIRTSLDTNINLLSFTPHYEWQNHTQYSMHLGWEFYSYFFVNHQLALKNNSIFFRHSKPLGLFNTPELNIYLREHLITQTDNLLQAGIRLKKFIETPIYFSRYPASIESIAPIVQFKYINYVDNDNDENKRVSFFEWTVGLGTNFLFHHKIKYALNFYFGFTKSLSGEFPVQQDSTSNIQPTFGLRFHRR